MVFFGFEWLIVFVCIYLSIFNIVDRFVDKIIFNNFEIKKKKGKKEMERLRENKRIMNICIMLEMFYK